jgi:tripartite-type tricarboxylate transporter receptor subunit TctC
MQAIRLSLIVLCCASAWLAASAQAQGNYPSKPIRFIVAYTAGGLGDTFGRAMSQHLSQRLGQPVLVENRPGASQVIALDAVAKSVPDGYTLVYGTQSGMVFTTAMKKSLPYDPLKDFAAISMLFATPFFLLVHPSIPAKNVLELIAYVKANPGKLSYASVGVGSGQHVAMELFRNQTGLDMVHVPYKGSAPASIDLVTGRVQVMFEGPMLNEANIRSGKLRALASSGTQRMRAMPQLPTVMESGVPTYNIATWFGLQTTAGVPRPIIDRLNQEVGEWLRSTETREKLADQFSLDITPSTPEEMAERISREIPIFTKLMRASGIEPE